MANLRIGYVGLLLLSFSSLGIAQSTRVDAKSAKAQQPEAQSAEPASETGAAPDDGATRVRRRARPAPCWRQAGLTPDMVNQRWKLEDEQKSKIAAVCTEPSTSAQQKHDKIEQIQVETDQAIARLIPVKERKAFDQCQAGVERSKPHPAGQKELGPCGGIIPEDDMSNGAEEHSH
ncbi:MAG: hypothetical protein ACM3WP_09810 [Acidobacteriota bacterium]